MNVSNEIKEKRVRGKFFSPHYNGDHMTPEHDVTGQQLGEEREGGIETEKLSHLTKKKTETRTTEF